MMKNENTPGEAVRLPEPGTLLVSSSPHIHDRSGTAKIMGIVILSLLPAAAAGVWYFGTKALSVIAYCCFFAVAAEALCCRISDRRQTVGDLSALLTGLILALNLPPGAPWWLCLTGAVIAIAIGKAVFGGLGQNPFNPAAVARVALLTGFAGPMTHWVTPVHHGAAAVTSASFAGAVPDAITGATPLARAAEIASGKLPEMETAARLGEFVSQILGDAFRGNVPGCIGETCVPAILLGGIVLILLGIIRWQIPAAMLGTAALFTAIVHFAAPSLTPGPVFHLCTGGLMFGAFFMATDTVTSPVTRKGCVVFGAGIGLIACIIRIWGAYPEGTSFAILLMNALVPLIDKVCYQHPFGWVQGGGR